ncbi:MAG: hypothetical protein ACRED2_12035, partial [Methylocella sp.]
SDSSTGWDSIEATPPGPLHPTEPRSRRSVEQTSVRAASKSIMSARTGVDFPSIRKRDAEFALGIVLTTLERQRECPKAWTILVSLHRRPPDVC